ncbi:ribosome maturation factor RimP [Natronosporangium hydrolyticum]|uniref:Ribosome maturation factor RimP n=1 Tax=Natronosporangium hydrolyticum TaxID=2811111 RepID=A0A895Y6X0_9ACTN|nr:ribosome maturation factor RimP [Natronosporangium hydrolyticum]QSB13487.1 ribosome maturation factor RimP [Natronosporangium hydrolyticum]
MPRGRGDEQTGRAAAPPPRTGPRALPARVTALIAPVVEAAGFDLERVGVSRIGRRHSVQVVVDRDGGVGLDAIAEVSRSVSSALDAAEEAGESVIPGEYVLEVTSPGVDRPLTEPRHWRRNVGRLVSVPGPGGARLTGRVLETNPETVVLELATGPRELRYDELGPGRVQVELRSIEEQTDELADPDGDEDGESESR